jgi:hypothetical protein
MLRENTGRNARGTGDVWRERASQVSAARAILAAPSVHAIRQREARVSEYQWYEFVVLDRPLSAREMAELRAISTRAEITPTRFWNEYEWGDLKADPARLLARYFDAHLYFANWGTHRFMLRLPGARVDERTLRSYVPRGGPVALTRVTARGEAHFLLDFLSESEDADEEWWKPQSLGALTPLRAQLLDGDYSALYLAWMLAVQYEAVDDDAVEPPVARGLAAPSAPLVALAEFLRVDRDLLRAAAEGVEHEALSPEALGRWVAALPAAEKDRWLCRAIERPIGAELLGAFRAQTETRAGERRTVAELRALAARVRAARERAAARRRAAREAAAEATRRRRLAEVAAEGDAAWERLDRLVGESAYEDAMRLTLDLRDLAQNMGAGAAFDMRLAALKKRHPRRRGFLSRLKEAFSPPGRGATA